LARQPLSVASPFGALLTLRLHIAPENRQRQQLFSPDIAAGYLGTGIAGALHGRPQGTRPKPDSKEPFEILRVHAVSRECPVRAIPFTVHPKNKPAMRRLSGAKKAADFVTVRI